MEVILTATRENGIFVHDLHTSAPVTRFRDSCTHGRAFTGIGDDSAYLVAAQTQRALLHFWRWGKEQPCYRASVPERLTATAFSSDGSMFFAGGVSGKLYVWQMSTGVLLRCVDAHYKAITSLVVSDDDNMLVTAAEDALVNVFVIATLLESADSAPFQTLSGHGLSVTSVAITPGGIHSSIVSASLDRSVKVWDMSTGKLKRNYVLPTFANAVAVTCDGKYVFAACGDSKAYMLSEEDAGIYAAFEGHMGPLISVSLSHDNQTLVTACQGDGVRMWDVATRQCVRHLHTVFQNAQITGVKVCHRTVSPTPLPEFKPLQRVVTCASQLQVQPVFVRREPLQLENDEVDRFLDRIIDELDVETEKSALQARVKQLEEEQKRWAAATHTLFMAATEKSYVKTLIESELPQLKKAVPAKVATLAEAPVERKQKRKHRS